MAPSEVVTNETLEPDPAHVQPRATACWSGGLDGNPPSGLRSVVGKTWVVRVPAADPYVLTGKREGCTRALHRSARRSECQRELVRPGAVGAACAPSGLPWPHAWCVSPRSTVFLMGPMKQLKRMFEPTRLIATIMVLVSAPAGGASGRDFGGRSGVCVLLRPFSFHLDLYLKPWEWASNKDPHLGFPLGLRCCQFYKAPPEGAACLISHRDRAASKLDALQVMGGATGTQRRGNNPETMGSFPKGGLRPSPPCDFGVAPVLTSLPHGPLPRSLP